MAPAGFAFAASAYIIRAVPALPSRASSAGLIAIAGLMSIRVKFNLLLVCDLPAQSGRGCVVLPPCAGGDAINDVRQNSQVLMKRRSPSAATPPTRSSLISTRSATSASCRRRVPAFAATETLRRLRDRFPPMNTKEAVLNPTNPRDRASDWERTLIENSAQTPRRRALTGLQGEGVQRSVYVARPIIIKQAQCGLPQVCRPAPASMLQIYGEKKRLRLANERTIGMQVVAADALSAGESTTHVLQFHVVPAVHFRADVSGAEPW